MGTSASTDYEQPDGASPQVNPEILGRDWSFAASNLRLLDSALDGNRPEHRTLLDKLRKMPHVYGRGDRFRNHLLQQYLEEVLRDGRPDWLQMPVHIFPVVLDDLELPECQKLGVIVPLGASEYAPGNWYMPDVARVADRVETGRGRLDRFLSAMEQVWSDEPLPLWGRCGIEISRSIPDQSDRIGGRSYEFLIDKDHLPHVGVICRLQFLCSDHASSCPQSPG